MFLFLEEISDKIEKFYKLICKKKRVWQIRQIPVLLEEISDKIEDSKN